MKVSELRGCGPKTAEMLKKLGIRTVEELVLHLPSSYEDRTRVVPMANLERDVPALVAGAVKSCRYQQDPGFRLRYEVLLGDNTGDMRVHLFHRRAPWVDKAYRRGKRFAAYGTPRQWFEGSGPMVMSMPDLEPLDEGARPKVHTRLTPVYPLTKGLTQGVLRRLMRGALNGYEFGWRAPRSVRERLLFPDMLTTLWGLHEPEDLAHVAWHRDFLAFEEMLARYVVLRRVRDRMEKRKAMRLVTRDTPPLLGQFFAALPFDRTDAQRETCDQVEAWLGREVPAQVLIQGDVGCGKTVVAGAAVIQTVVGARMQAAVLAPTELLAEQHERTLASWLRPWGSPVLALRGSQGRSERATAMSRLAAGEPLVAVGTHAIFQAGVEMPNLALVVIDEQHRFGVEQRLALLDKSTVGDRSAHLLMMTATPIPRTLYMTQYADMDVETISELPPGREPVITRVRSESGRENVFHAVMNALSNGAQAYWVCPAVELEDGDESGMHAAVDVFEEWKSVLPDRVGLVHGQMKSAEKNAAMRAFRDGTTRLLVATTVVEVGVDVPDATIMVIENAERFGLSQLHQLRGRVGRGSIPGKCVALHGRLSMVGHKRMEAFRSSTDGFYLAEKDLELRGAGEVLGVAQAGFGDMKVAEDVQMSSERLTDIGKAGREMLDGDPGEVSALLARWLGGRADEFAQV